MGSDGAVCCILGFRKSDVHKMWVCHCWWRERVSYHKDPPAERFYSLQEFYKVQLNSSPAWVNNLNFCIGNDGP